MTQTGPDVRPSLVDVSGYLLADLALIDRHLLDDAIARLLPPSTNSGDRTCGGSGSRLWQNY